MGRQKNDILQGTLALLILKALESKGPMHGYGLTSHIQEQSEDLLRIEEGSLYPALHRMEQDGWVRSEWRVTEKGRKARFYALTASGQQQLVREQESWKRLTRGVALVLREA
jgi:transcriptional regulator